MSPRDTTELLTLLALVGQLGLIMAGTVVGGFLAGMYVDQWLGTGATFKVILLLAGIGGGMVAVYRLVMKAVEPHLPDDSGNSIPNGQ
ncbi:MAG: AtpZ/AtpI family protein [Candidatus Brocadiaceae bacterium]|jgi:F0F1-type ATP synthase assembly protein I